MSIQYILCDVEGTTTDIQFVHQELFPYARTALPQFFASNPQEREKSAQILGVSVQEVVVTLQDYIDRDVKDAELKRIQGKIWAIGYANGELKGHVYTDVPNAFARWTKAGKTLGIYSSGSVRAQKLIYGHSIAGDLTVYLTHHFDLAQGYKYQPQSYQNILSILKIPAEEILFLSDVEAELDASSSVGMKSIRLFRDVVLDSKHPWARDFDEVERMLGAL